MIKLSVTPAPSFLTIGLVEELTNKFLEDNSKRVWNRSDLKKALFDLSYGKCVYSEAKLGEEGKYMQVDHFYPKSKYPHRVLEWGNLLPCINVCNSKKKDCDPNRTPIVNPFTDNPKDYFFVLNGRIYPINRKNLKAINTIEKCDLNNDRHFRTVRYKIEIGLKERLEDIFTIYKSDSLSGIKRLKSLMNDCGRTSSYSATKSTVILSNDNFGNMRRCMLNAGQWSDEFIRLEEELKFCSLPIPIKLHRV